MIFGKSKPRPIDDFDMDLVDGWFRVEADDPRWPARQAEEAGASAEASPGLIEQLTSLAKRVTELDEHGTLSMVWIPEDSPDHVRCICTFHIMEVPVGGPKSYEQSLAADEGHRQPGERFDIVRTWNVPVPAGLAVGGYQVITFSDLLDEVPHTEERTIIGVFPEGGSEMLEFIFTTNRLDEFDDFVAATMGYVSTVEIQLGR